jgi:heme/copper-type cytochrome/quinol oxidase subunit 1
VNLRRLRPAEWLLAVSAVALVVALFLPWNALPTVNGQPVNGGWTAYAPIHFGFADRNAWQSFAVVAAVLLACVLVVALAVVLQATQRSPALPVISSVAATWAALVAFVLTLIEVLDGTDLRYGAWIGLAASVGLVAGGWWAIRDDKPGFSLRKSHLESSG